MELVAYIEAAQVPHTGAVARVTALQERPGTAGQDERPAQDERPREGTPPGRRDVPLSPIVVEDPKDLGPVTPQTGVADVLLGSIALIAAILVAALVLGLAGGVLRVYIVHTLGLGGPEVDEADHIRLDIGRVTSEKRAGRHSDATSALAEPTPSDVSRVSTGPD